MLQPYIGEYENDLRLPHYMEEIGFSEVNEISYNYFESIFTATKWIIHIQIHISNKTQ